MFPKYGAHLRRDRNVYANNTALAESAAQAGVIKQRPTLVDSRLNNQVRARPIDYFLESDQVLRQLKNRLSHPSKSQEIAQAPTRAHPLPGNQLKSTLRV